MTIFSGWDHLKCSQFHSMDSESQRNGPGRNRIIAASAGWDDVQLRETGGFGRKTGSQGTYQLLVVAVFCGVIERIYRDFTERRGQRRFRKRFRALAVARSGKACVDSVSTDRWDDGTSVFESLRLRGIGRCRWGGVEDEFAWKKPAARARDGWRSVFWAAVAMFTAKVLQPRRSLWVRRAQMGCRFHRVISPLA
jgi:hypothetical protein